MKTILYIQNTRDCHYEIIESVIVKYRRILKLEDSVCVDEIYLDIPPESKTQNNTYKTYIVEKYPNLILGIPSYYEYYINTSTDIEECLPEWIKNLDKTKNFFISHRVSEKSQMLDNVYHLTPLASHNVFWADILPFAENKTKSHKPVFIVQGNIEKSRRNWDLLNSLLKNANYDKEFLIKIVGRKRDVKIHELKKT